MPATTPVFGWPYQVRGDAPDGPVLGQNLALAIESTVGGLASLPNVQVFTAGGTWTKPAGARTVVVECVGGGGGGGGCAVTSAGQSACGGGGGGGEYARGIFNATTLGATETVGVGAAGAAGAAGANNGGTAGTSSLGAWVTAVGGAGGSGAASAANTVFGGGVGGTGGTGGDVHIAGQRGDTGRVVGGVPVCVTRGGDSELGFGGAQALATNSGAGQAGQSYGGGGGGAINRDTVGTPAQAGGAGAAGLVVVTTYF